MSIRTPSSRSRTSEAFASECLYTWIYRIVTNLCLDHLRKNVRAQGRCCRKTLPVASTICSIRLLTDVPENPERDLMRRQLGARISPSARKATPRERMVFELKHYHGLKLHSGRDFAYYGRDRQEYVFRATQKLRASWRICGSGTEYVGTAALGCRAGRSPAP